MIDKDYLRLIYPLKFELGANLAKHPG